MKKILAIICVVSSLLITTPVFAATATDFQQLLPPGRVAVDANGTCIVYEYSGLSYESIAGMPRWVLNETFAVDYQTAQAYKVQANSLGYYPSSVWITVLDNVGDPFFTMTSEGILMDAQGTVVQWQ